MKNKPTIEEIEEILDGREKVDIEILPSGEIVEKNKDLLRIIKEIRRSDCGSWLKDCSEVYKCADGRAKRHELAKLLDKLYEATKRGK